MEFLGGVAGRLARCVLPPALFFLGWTVEAGVDLSQRLEDGSVGTGGLHPDVWFSLHVVLAVCAVYLAWKLWADLRPAARAGVVAVYLGLGFPVYTFVCLEYALGVGVNRGERHPRPRSRSRSRSRKSSPAGASLQE